MATDADRYARVYSVFREVRGVAPEQRPARLESLCGSDLELRAEVESLLNADEHGEDAGPLAEPELAAARRAVDQAIGKPPAPGAQEADGSGWLPEHIGAYRIERRIGQGGMGVVYEALQESPRRRVAIKLLRPTESTSERAKRFRQEAELLGRLQHPGIAQILEAGTFDLGHGPQPFFAMELVEGVDLRLYADREHLDVRAKLALLAKVADAVHHAHERGVVHRDLKPDNVLVDERGQPKVLDFGIARAKETSEVLSTLVTREGVLMGTLAYMAPEQLEGGVITARTDVFALGVLAYELLTGRLPHEIGGLELPAALHVLEKQPTVALRVLAPELRGDVDTIVTKALTREPEKRYASAAAFAADLRRHLDNLPIEARPPSRLYRFRKYARRNRSIVAIAATLLVAAVVSTWFGLRTERALRQSERTNYEVRMLTASREVEEGELSRGFMDSFAPELRGWEWRHLNSRIEAPLIPFEGNDIGMQVLPGSSQVFVGTVEGDLFWLDLEDRRIVRSARVEAGLAAVEVSLESGDVLVAGSTSGFAGGRESECWAGWWRLGDQTVHDRLRFRAVGASLTVDPVRGVVFGHDGTRCFLIDVDTGEELASRELPVGRIASFGPDGRTVLVEGQGRLWRLDGSTLATLDDWPDVSSSDLSRPFVLSPGETHLAFGNDEGELQLWDLRQEPPARRLLMRSRGNVSAAALSSDGSKLASGHLDGIRVWEVETGQLMKRLSNEGGSLTASFLDNGLRLLTCTDDGLHERFLEDPFVLSEHESFVYAGDFAPRAGLLVSGGWDGHFGTLGSLRLWDARTGVPVARWVGSPEFVTDLVVDAERSRVLYAPMGSIPAVIPSGSRIASLDLRTGERAALHECEGRLDKLDLSPAGTHVAWVESVGLADPTGVVFALEPGTVVASVQLTGGSFNRANHPTAWSPDGSWLVFAEGDHVQVLEGRMFETAARWPVPVELARDIDFSPEGDRVVVAGSDGAVPILSIPEGALLGALEGHTAKVLCASYSPDGKRIATGARDGVVRIWDAETHALVTELRGHDDYVYALSWSDDGETLLSSSGDTTLRVWTTETTRERMQARREREAIVARVEPVVTRLFEDLKDAAAVADRLDELLEGPTGWTPREREVAGQVLLGRVY